MPQTPAEFEQWKREEYRKSMDTWLVYNPTDKDYFVTWDKIPHLIPNKNRDIGFGNGQAELSKFLAEKYMAEMKDRMINEENAKKIEEAVEKKAKLGIQLTPYEKNVQIVEYLPKTSDEKSIIEKYGILFKGVVREFGIYDDMPMESMEKPDTRSPEERAMEALMNKKSEPVQATTAPTINDKAKKVAEITQE